MKTICLLIGPKSSSDPDLKEDFCHFMGVITAGWGPGAGALLGSGYWLNLLPIAVAHVGTVLARFPR